jgi:hypothetical protein
MLFRYAVGIAAALAIHAPLLRSPPAPAKKIDIGEWIELSQDMKAIEKTLAALEEKAKEEAPLSPAPREEAKPVPVAESGAQEKAREAAKEDEPGLVKGKDEGAPPPAPLTTPKMAESKLPPRPDAAPPPPPGSGDPKAEDARRIAYRESERGKGAPRPGGEEGGAKTAGPGENAPARAGEAPAPRPLKPPEPPPAAPPQAPPPPPVDPVREALAELARERAAAGAGADLAVALTKRIEPARPAVEAPPQPPGADAGAGGRQAARGRVSGAGPERAGSPGETSDDGLEVPTIHFRPWASRDEMIAVATYFGMQLIAYPDAHDYYVLIELASNRFEVSRNFGYLKLFSNRTIAQDGPAFHELRERIGRNIGASAERLTMAFLLPIKTANYFAWKETAVCRKAGFGTGEVESIAARFVRTGEAKWTLFVEEIRLRDGRRIPCGERENRVEP